MGRKPTGTKREPANLSRGSFMRYSTRIDGRDNNFNLLRMIAATAVLVSHAYPISLGNGAQEPLSATLPMSLGGLAVTTFFAISGFFISQSFDHRSSTLEFCLARVLRIYPGLLAVLLLTVFLLGPVFTELEVQRYFSDARTLLYIPRNLSLKWLQYDLPGVFDRNPYPSAINGSLWTLVYEVTCYAFVVAVGRLGLPAAESPRFVLFLAAYLLLHIGAPLIAPLHDIILKHQALESLSELSYPFILGMLIYHFREFLIPRLPLLALPALVAFGVLWWNGLLFRDAFVLLWTLFVFWAGYLPLSWLRLYNRLGDYSYGMYIYAFPCEQMCVGIWSGISPLSLMLASFPMTLACAIVSWHLVERRSLLFRRTLARRLVGLRSTVDLPARREV